MPRKAATSNRESIERALRPEQLRELRVMCRDLRVSPTGWHTQRDFRCYILAAIGNLAEALQGSGLSAEQARETAALRVGVSPDSHRTWLRRAQYESRGVPAAKVQPEPTDLVLTAAL